MECGAPTRSRFPDIYREFESLQARVRQAAQDYIIGPQVGPVPLEVRNIEVRSSTVNLWLWVFGEGDKLPVVTVLCGLGCQVFGDPG